MNLHKGSSGIVYLRLSVPHNHSTCVLANIAMASELFDPVVEDDLALERLGYKQGVISRSCLLLPVILTDW